MKLQHIAAAAIAATCFATSAQAVTTYSNIATSTINSMGAPDTTSYGEFFTAPGGVLQSFNFTAVSGNAGNVDLIIAAWDGAKAVGPALYTSAPIYYNGGTESLGASGINLALTTGTTYIAYLTVAGVSSPMSSVGIAGSDTDGGLGGGFRFLNSGGTNPLTLSNTWSGWSSQSMAYSATFTSAVPEPETYGMMLAGLALLGVVARRRAV